MESEFSEAINLLKNGHNQEGIVIIKRLAELGHIDSQRGLGHAYLLGEFGLDVNYEHAMYWYEKAADNNDTVALFTLGCMYDQGLGTKKDFEKSLSLLQKSADLGDDLAQFTVGRIYLYGIKTSPNQEMAEKYLNLAYSQGNKDAAYLLGIINLYSKDNQLQFSKSKEYFERSKGSNYDSSADTLLRLVKNPCKKYESKIWHLDELIDKLKNEHDENTFYRGQTHYYGHPLLPSIYRRGSSALSFKYSGDERLRKTGSSFSFSSSFANPSESSKIRRHLSKCISNAFGYTFTQAMFQQAGYESEGLDITSDFIISLLFSTYEYNRITQKFEIATNEENSVIYRWKGLTKPNPIKSLSSDYYNSPNVIPTYDIFSSFSTCMRLNDFYNSLQEYSKAISWGSMNFDIDEIRNHRPYSLIKLPESLLMKSRIIKQKASLLLPDRLISEKVYEYLCEISYPPPYYMENLPIDCIQDLSEETFCEIFVYERDNSLAEEIMKKANIRLEDIYDERIDSEDLSQMLLYGWFESIYSEYAGFCTPVINTDPLSNYNLEYYDMLSHLNAWKKKKTRNGYYFGED